MKITATKALSWITLIIGVLLLLSGIKGVIKLSSLSGEYKKTEGYFSDYAIYSKGGYDTARRRHTNDTYRLIYTYHVDGKEYQAATDMGFGMLPAYGSVKEILYNPDDPGDAFISGPNSNVFKIFMGLFFTAIPSFFIWLLKPEKKKTSIDGVGTIIGFLFMFFSYGMLYMISGEFSISGIVTFYRTSFIFPMIIPIILIAVGGYVFVKSLLSNHNREPRITRRTEEESKHKAKITVISIFIGILFLVLLVRGNFPNGNVDRIPKEHTKHTNSRITEKVNSADVHTILSETALQNSEKMFTLTENGTDSVVLYKNNVVIYAYSPEGENEIKDILTELGVSGM